MVSCSYACTARPKNMLKFASICVNWLRVVRVGRTVGGVSLYPSKGSQPAGIGKPFDVPVQTSGAPFRCRFCRFQNCRAKASRIRSG